MCPDVGSRLSLVHQFTHRLKRMGGPKKSEAALRTSWKTVAQNATGYRCFIKAFAYAIAVGQTYPPLVMTKMNEQRLC